MPKNRYILKVVKGTGSFAGKWIVKSNKLIDGWTIDDGPKNYSEAVDAAFKWAKKFKGAIVRIFDAKGKLEVEVNSIGVRNYVFGSYTNE